MNWHRLGVTLDQITPLVYLIWSLEAFTWYCYSEAFWADTDLVWQSSQLNDLNSSEFVVLVHCCDSPCQQAPQASSSNSTRLRHAVGRRREEGASGAPVVHQQADGWPAPRSDPGRTATPPNTYSFPASPPRHSLVSCPGCARLRYLLAPGTLRYPTLALLGTL